MCVWPAERNRRLRGRERKEGLYIVFVYGVCVCNDPNENENERMGMGMGKNEICIKTNKRFRLNVITLHSVQRSKVARNGLLYVIWDRYRVRRENHSASLSVR